jgi:hypothetical protein
LEEPQIGSLIAFHLIPFVYAAKSIGERTFSFYPKLALEVATLFSLRYVVDSYKITEQMDYVEARGLRREDSG